MTKKIITSRRAFIALGLGAALDGCAELTGWRGPIRRLYRAAVGWPDFREMLEGGSGFCREAGRLNFFPAGIPIDRKTKEYVMLLGEVHDNMEARHAITGFVDFMIDKYGIDSIGLEGLYGPPKVPALENDNTVQRHFDEFHAGFDPDIVGRESVGCWDFVKSQRVPVYGIEDMSAYLYAFPFNILQHYIAKAKWIRGSKQRHDFSPGSIMRRMIKGPEGITEEELIRLEGFMKEVREKYPTEDIPEDCFRSLTDPYSNTIENGVDRFARRVWEITVVERNKASSKVIPAQMKELGSKRSLMVIGAAHLQTHPDVMEQFGHCDLQKLLPYSALALDVTQAREPYGTF